MRNFNLDSTRIATMQQQSMIDTCSINSYSESTDSYGDLVKAYTSGSMSASSICGFSTNSGNKSYKQEEIIITWDATFRLPLDVIVTDQDTITLTRHNNVVVNQDFRILNLGIGSGEYVVKCQKMVV